MRKNRIIAMFVTLVLVFSSFIGCVDKKPEKFTITFEPNGGSVVASIDYTQGESISFVAPTKKGYQFVGWFNSAQLTGNPYFTLPAEFTGDKTLYASWKIAEYKIKYNLPIGASIPEGSNETFSYFDKSENVVTEATTLATTVVRNGYSFDGWYTNEQFSGTAVTEVPAGTYADYNVFPKFTAVTYNITYEVNGGQEIENDTFDVSTNKVVKVPAAREFYTFGGWYDNAEFTGSAVAFIAKNSRFADITLYAKWIGEEFDIDYVLDGGSFAEGVSYPKTYTFDGNVELVLPTHSEYAFGGWYDNAAFAGQPITTIAPEQSGKKTFYAKWVKVDFTISYNLNSGIFAGQYPQGYNVGDAIDLVSPTRTGYTFIGWYDNDSFNNSPINQIKATDSGNKTFFAKWELANYSIAFELDGGSFASGTRVSSYNMNSQTISLVTNSYIPTKLGYKFNGWFATQDFSTPVVNAIVKGSTGNKTLYAKFDIITYKLTYQLSGGSLGTLPNISEFNVTMAVSLPATNPTKVGYTFVGWYNDSSFAVENKTGITVGTINDKTIYAKWSANVYNISYEVDGGTLPSNYITTYTYDTLTFLPIPTKAGFDFGGWFETATPNTKIGSLAKGTINDKSLKALWLTSIATNKSQKMEAEHTNLEGKVGAGGSGSALGSEMISTNFPNASNGQCIPWTWAPGISIEWEFNLDRAVTSSSIVISFGNEIGSQVTFTNETTAIRINGKLYAGTWSLPVPDKQFVNLTINLTNNNPLYSGYNVISIEVLPNELAPGIAGYGPIFDCITLNAKANIEWKPIIWKE